MSTNQQIVDRAAYELGYIEYGKNLDATDGADAMADLNAMMAEWRVSDKDLNWFSQDTLSETCPIPDWAERGVISNLAVSLGAVFNVAVSNETAIKASNGSNVIARTLINHNLEQADMSHLPQGEGRAGRNILTDT